MATTLNLNSSFGFTDLTDGSPSVTPDRGLQGDGIAYNGTNLFVVRTDAPTGPASRTQTILRFDTAGNYLGEFDLAAIGTVAVGATVLGNGNLLLATLNPPGDGTFVTRLIEVAPDGSVPTGGIDLALPAEFNDRDQRGLAVGVAYSPAYSTNSRLRSKDDTILVITSRSQEIVEFDLQGNIVSSVDLSQYGVTAPQGLAINPVTGNIFVADEATTSGGTNKIYEISPLRDELAIVGSNTGIPRFGSLVSIIDTSQEFGLTDPEGLAFSADGSILYVVFDGDDANGSNSVVEFSRQTPTGIPTLKTIDKFGVAGQAIPLTVEDFTTIPAQNFAPIVPAFSGTTLAGITILGLPGAGTLTLNGATVSVGDVLTAAQIPALSYTSNANFSGVDTFQVSASDGTASSAPAHIDLFVSSPTAAQLTATNVFSIDLGVPDDVRFNNSADGIVFNPTNNKVYTSSSFRIVPTDPATIGWRLIESNPDGSQSRVILQSEAQASTAGPTPFTPLAGVPVLDLVAGTQTDGIQDLAVVQGTGTARDGNLLIVSTRGALVRELTPDGVLVDGGINFDAPGLFELGSAFNRSAVGMVHAVENGQEFIYVTDFGERLIRKVPALTGTNAAPANLTEAQVVSTIALQSALPESRLQDLTIDPITGNFFVADDASGNAAIYEISPDGTVLGSTDMLALGQQLGLERGLSGQALTDFVNKFADLEGISIDPLTRTLYAAIDDDGVGQFGLQNIGGQVVAIALSNYGFDPNEPGNQGFFRSQTAVTLEISIRSNTTIKLASELVVFLVDDAAGTVGGNAPGSAGYLNAILDNQNLLGTMSFLAGLDNPSGLGDFADIIDDFSQLIDLAAGQRIGFLLVEGGSLGDEGTSIFYSNQSNFSVGSFSNRSFSLSFSGTDVSFDLDLKAEPPGLGKKRFGLQTGREYLECLDRRGQDALTGNSVRVYSEAAFDNLVGFYLTDINGNVLNITTGNVEAAVEDGSDYLAAVVANRLDISLSANTTTTIDFVANAIITPFLVSNGTFENFTNVFTPFFSTDNFDHFRLLGSGTFAVEDQLNGGDKDFDDMIIQVTFS